MSRFQVGDKVTVITTAIDDMALRENPEAMISGYADVSGSYLYVNGPHLFMEQGPFHAVLELRPGWASEAKAVDARI